MVCGVGQRVCHIPGVISVCPKCGVTCRLSQCRVTTMQCHDGQAASDELADCFARSWQTIGLCVLS